MMFGYDMTAAGWFWMVGGGLVVVLAIVGGAWLIAHSIQTNGPRRATPLDILEERFARGELPQDEYEKAKQALR
jgi:putative membrane protein